MKSYQRFHHSHKTALRLLVVATLAIGFTACDTKTCYCYEVEGNRGMVESVYTIDDAKMCSTLTTYSRTCVESNERMNPNDIAW